MSKKDSAPPKKKAPPPIPQYQENIATDTFAAFGVFPPRFGFSGVQLSDVSSALSKTATFYPDLFVCGGCDASGQPVYSGGHFLDLREPRWVPVTKDLVKSETTSQIATSISFTTTLRNRDDQSNSLLLRGMVESEPPSPRYYHTCVVAGGYIWVIGGWNGRTATPDIFCLDPKTLNWFCLPQANPNYKPPEYAQVTSILSQTFLATTLAMTQQSPTTPTPFPLPTTPALPSTPVPPQGSPAPFSPSISTTPALSGSTPSAPSIPLSPLQFHNAVAFGPKQDHILIYGSWGVKEDKQLLIFNTATCELTRPKVRGKPPPSSYGQSAVLIGGEIFFFGGLKWNPDDSITIEGAIGSEREEEGSGKGGKGGKGGAKEKGKEKVVSVVDPKELEASALAANGGAGVSLSTRVDPHTLSIATSFHSTYTRPSTGVGMMFALRIDGEGSGDSGGGNGSTSVVTWRPVDPPAAPLPSPPPRMNHSAVAVGELMYVMGGVWKGTAYHNDIWCYHTRLGFWREHRFVRSALQGSGGGRGIDGGLRESTTIGLSSTLESTVPSASTFSGGAVISANQRSTSLLLSSASSSLAGSAHSTHLSSSSSPFTPRCSFLLVPLFSPSTLTTLSSLSSTISQTPSPSRALSPHPDPSLESTSDGLLSRTADNALLSSNALGGKAGLAAAGLALDPSMAALAASSSSQPVPTGVKRKAELIRLFRKTPTLPCLLVGGEGPKGAMNDSFIIQLPLE